MKRTRLQAFSILLAVLLLTGCADEQSPDITEVSHIDMIITGMTTSALQENTTSAGTSETRPIITTTTVTEETVTETTASSTTTTTTARFPAESTDYGNSDTPHPLNFSYRFTTEGIALRIEGGNYQTLHYALSSETAAALSDTYIIQDCNFDGHYDLLLPVAYSTASVTYALFLWDEETLRFRADAIELVNPVFDAVNRKVSSTMRASAVVYTYEIYVWNGHTPVPELHCIADFERLTLTSLRYENGLLSSNSVENYADSDALQAALDALKS